MIKKLKFIPLELEQRSDEWHEYRKLGLGASEIGVLMGALPFLYEDILELYKKKAGLPVDEFIVTEAIQHGIDTEDEALEKFTEATGISMEPKCFVHPTYSYLRASLDGVDSKLKNGVEIKCPAISNFNKAKKGLILDYHYSQLQSQMLCTGLDSMYYWVYRVKEGGLLFKVPRNEEYIQEIIRRATIFWEMLQKQEPVLPRHLGIDMWKDSDPYQAGDMSYEFIRACK